MARFLCCIFAFAALVVFVIIGCSLHAVKGQRIDAGRELLFAHKNGIGFLQLGTNVTSIFPAIFPTDGVTFDFRRGYLYWATRTYNGNAGGIYRANLDGTEVTKYVATEAIDKLNETFFEREHIKRVLNKVGNDRWNEHRSGCL